MVGKLVVVKVFARVVNSESWSVIQHKVVEKDVQLAEWREACRVGTKVATKASQLVVKLVALLEQLKVHRMESVLVGVKVAVMADLRGVSLANDRVDGKVVDWDARRVGKLEILWAVA